MADTWTVVRHGDRRGSRRRPQQPAETPRAERQPSPKPAHIDVPLNLDGFKSMQFWTVKVTALDKHGEPASLDAAFPRNQPYQIRLADRIAEDMIGHGYLVVAHSDTHTMLTKLPGQQDPATIDAGIEYQARGFNISVRRFSTAHKRQITVVCNRLARHSMSREQIYIQHCMLERVQSLFPPEAWTCKTMKKYTDKGGSDAVMFVYETVNEFEDGAPLPIPNADRRSITLTGHGVTMKVHTYLRQTRPREARPTILPRNPGHKTVHTATNLVSTTLDGDKAPEHAQPSIPEPQQPRPDTAPSTPITARQDPNQQVLDSHYQREEPTTQQTENAVAVRAEKSTSGPALVAARGNGTPVTRVESAVTGQATRAPIQDETCAVTGQPTETTIHAETHNSTTRPQGLPVTTYSGAITSANTKRPVEDRGDDGATGHKRTRVVTLPN